jgi:hypothetical protein
MTLAVRYTLRRDGTCHACGAGHQHTCQHLSTDTGVGSRLWKIVNVD